MFFISLRRGSAKMLRLPRARGQIGRASCRERGEISVGAVLFKKKKKKIGKERGVSNIEEEVTQKRQFKTPKSHALTGRLAMMEATVMIAREITGLRDWSC